MATKGCKAEERKLPIPEILNLDLEIREAAYGEVTVEYKLSELPADGISGVVVFLRPIQDKHNFPPVKLKHPQRGSLSTNDTHYIFLPPKRNTPAHIKFQIPLYTTYMAGIATFKLHEHSNLVTQEGLDNQGSFELSEIKLLKKTFPLKLELPKEGTLRIEGDPNLDEGPTYLSQASQDATQRYRFTQTFIDEFRTTRNLNLDRSHNIKLEEGVNGARVALEEQIYINESIQLIDGLKAPDQPTTFTLFSPLETPDVYKFNRLTWVGEDVNVYCATGYSIGDVTETENFRLIQQNQDIDCRPREDSFNIRVDFLKPTSYIKNVILHYTRLDPAIILTNTISTEHSFNHAAVFIDTDDLPNVIVEMSNDGGKTFVEPEGGEGLDYFKFPTPGNKAVLKIQMFGDSYIEGYAINVGLLQTAAPEPIDGPNPIEL